MQEGLVPRDDVVTLILHHKLRRQPSIKLRVGAVDGQMQQLPRHRIVHQPGIAQGVRFQIAWAERKIEYALVRDPLGEFCGQELVVGLAVDVVYCNYLGWMANLLHIHASLGRVQVNHLAGEPYHSDLAWSRVLGSRFDCRH